MAPASIYNDSCIYVVHTVCSNKKYVSIPSSYYLPEHCVKLTVVTCRYTLYFSVYWQSMLLYGFRWIRTSAARYVTWRVRTNQRWTRITSYVPYRAEHVCVRRLRQALHDEAVATTSHGASAWSGRSPEAHVWRLLARIQHQIKPKFAYEA